MPKPPARQPDRFLPLSDLQYAQLCQDRDYHRDIAALPIHERLKHLWLHIIKYTGEMHVLGMDESSRPKAERLVTDMFIMCLSVANVLNIDLATHVDQKPRPEAPVWPLGISLDILRVFGPGAKALEAQDHMENFPVRATLTTAVIDGTALIIGVSKALGFDLAVARDARLDVVRAKNIFHKHHVAKWEQDGVYRAFPAGSDLAACPVKGRARRVKAPALT